MSVLLSISFCLLRQCEGVELWEQLFYPGRQGLVQEWLHKVCYGQLWLQIANDKSKQRLQTRSVITQGLSSPTSPSSWSSSPSSSSSSSSRCILRLYGTRCSKCCHLITQSDWIRRAGDQVGGGGDGGDEVGGGGDEGDQVGGGGDDGDQVGCWYIYFRISMETFEHRNIYLRWRWQQLDRYKL